MTLTQTRAIFGLRSASTPTSTAATNSILIGLPNTAVSLADANTTWAAQALLVGSASDLIVTLAAASSAGSTTWTAGAAQVDTATVVGSASSTGNLNLVLTAADLTGSPLTVPVALANGTHTSAALVAAACRAALAANTAVAAKFTIGGTGAAITITRVPLAVYTVGSASVPTYRADDATLNLAIPAALGITAAASSTNTTAGVLSAGCYISDADGKDWEGNTLTPIAASRLGGFIVRNHPESSGGVTLTAASLSAFPLPVDGVLQFTAAKCNGALQTITVEPISTALVTIISTGATV